VLGIAAHEVARFVCPQTKAFGQVQQACKTDQECFSTCPLHSEAFRRSQAGSASACLIGSWCAARVDSERGCCTRIGCGASRSSANRLAPRFGSSSGVSGFPCSVSDTESPSKRTNTNSPLERLWTGWHEGGWQPARREALRGSANATAEARSDCFSPTKIAGASGKRGGEDYGEEGVGGRAGRFRAASRRHKRLGIARRPRMMTVPMQTGRPVPLGGLMTSSRMSLETGPGLCVFGEESSKQSIPNLRSLPTVY